MLRAYLQLFKPGIVLGNLVSFAGGYLLASRGGADAGQFALAGIGVALVVASGCAVNNVHDRDIDALMARTRRRPTVSGAIPVPVALAGAVFTGLAGMLLLYGATGRLLPVGLLLAGYAVYAGLYTFCLKRRSIHGTLAGSIAGALPPVVGYCAVTGRVDSTALTLLLMFGLWQVPHSYAIAIVRGDDYRAAALPVLPVVKGHAVAKRHIVGYIVAFIGATLLLAAGWVYHLCAAMAGLYWLLVALGGFYTGDDVRWARKVFVTSIAVVIVLSAAMAGSFVPLEMP